MAVTIVIPTPLRQFADGAAQLVFEANNVGEALDSLTTSYAELRKHLFTDQNALRSFVNVYVNDEDIRHAQALDTPVSDGDTVMIVPSIAGGR
jgi:molybdopterin converting factor small subunit